MVSLFAVLYVMTKIGTRSKHLHSYFSLFSIVEFTLTTTTEQTKQVAEIDLIFGCFSGVRVLKTTGWD